MFTELNPRFQGSSALSAAIAQELEAPDLYLDHLAASLGLVAPSRGISMREWAARQPALSRVVAHNTAAAPLLGGCGDAFADRVPEGRVSQLAEGLPVDPGGALYGITLRRSVTRTGFDLDRATERLVGTLRSCFDPVADSTARRPSPTHESPGAGASRVRT